MAARKKRSKKGSKEKSRKKNIRKEERKKEGQIGSLKYRKMLNKETKPVFL